MIEEVRRLAKRDISKSKTIRMLQAKGVLKSYISEAGYRAYDTKEYATYRRTVRRGRPLKDFGGGNETGC